MVTLAADLAASVEGRQSKNPKIQCGQLLPNSAVIFEKAEGSPLNLIGKSKGFVEFFISVVE